MSSIQEEVVLVDAGEKVVGGMVRTKLFNFFNKIAHCCVKCVFSCPGHLATRL